MKKALPLLLSMLLALVFAVGAGALELQTVEQATASENDGSAAALAATAVVPGINAANGTTTVIEDFSTTDLATSQLKFSVKGGSVSAKIGTAAVGGSGDTNKAVIVECAGTTADDLYPLIDVNCYMEPGRKYYISFDLFSAKDGNCLWIMDGGSIATNFNTVTGNDNKKYNQRGTNWFSYTNKEYVWAETLRSQQVLRFEVKATKLTTGTPYTYTWYLDNLMAMPYYKTTYMGADGTPISTEQYLFDSDGNIVVSYTPKTNNYPDNVFSTNAEGKKTVKVCIGWATTENATVPETSIELKNEDVILYPVWDEIVLEDDTYGTLIYYDDFSNNDTKNPVYSTVSGAVGGALADTIEIVDDPVEGGTHGKVLKMTPGTAAKPTDGCWPGYILWFTGTNNLTDYGTYTLIGDIYYPNEYKGNANLLTTFYTNGVEDHSGQSAGIKAKGEWTTIPTPGQRAIVKAEDTFYYTYFDKGKNRQVNSPFASATYTSTKIQNAVGRSCSYPAASFYKMYFFSGLAAGYVPDDNICYLDNVRLYFQPTCRVAYDYGDYTAEQVGGKEYQYLKKGESVLTAEDFTVSGTGLTLTGWSKTNPATVTEGTPVFVNSITDEDIAEKEITLYAVWSEEDPPAYAVTSDNLLESGKLFASGKSGTTVTLTANHLTTWNVDTGYSEAEITSTSTTLTVKPIGYSGIVIVTGTSCLDDSTQTIEIHLICGNLQKPGLNALTGTPDPVTFEDSEDLYLSRNGSFTISRVANTLGNQSSNYIFQISGTNTGGKDGSYASVIIPVAPEADRKYALRWDDYQEITEKGSDDIPKTFTDYNSGWLLNFKSDNTHVELKTHLPAWKDAHTNNQWYTHSFDEKAQSKTSIALQYKVGTAYTTTVFNIYLDNLSVIPYYKVTYIIDGDQENPVVEYVLPKEDEDFKLNDAYAGASYYTVNSPDGTKYPVEQSYQLNHEDITVYVWHNPITVNRFSIRTAGPQALRFLGYVPLSLHKLAAEDDEHDTEYGILIARKDIMQSIADKKEEETDYRTLLHFGGVTEGAQSVYYNSDNVPFVYGAAFKRDPENGITVTRYELSKPELFTDEVFTENASYFVAALTGIPAKNYKTVICGRTYVKIGDVYYYGDVVEASIYDVAVSIQGTDGYQTMSDKDKAVIDNIVTEGNGSTQS